MRSFFTYGPGIPTYVGLWVVLTPVALVLLRRFAVPLPAAVAFLAITAPASQAGSVPLLTPLVRYVVVTAALLYLLWWTTRQVSRPSADVAGSVHPVPWKPVVVLVLLTLTVRVPLAFIDPGISPIGLSTEYAVQELLGGRNPYSAPNPFADFGTYQYPIGTVLANVPLVALMPDVLLGEAHLGIRATSWLVDVGIVLAMVSACARRGRARLGLLAGGLFALCAPLVRDSGLSTANDLLLAFAVVLFVDALSAGRLRSAGMWAGVAIAVKPPAVLLLPLLVGAVGLAPALLAATVPALLQLPFLLWQSPGRKALEALAEPAGRRDGDAFLPRSLWYPLLSVTSGPLTLRVLALLGIAVAAAAAFWAGRRLRSGDLGLAQVAAATALPLLVVFALAPVPRLNYQDWYAPVLLLAVAHAVRSRAERDPVSRGLS